MLRKHTGNRVFFFLLLVEKYGIIKKKTQEVKND